MNSPESAIPNCGDPVLDGLERGFLVGGGRYTLERIIRADRGGPVWLGLDHQLGEHVALKFLLNSLVSNAASFNEFRRSVQECRKLSHVGIVRIHDLVCVPDEPAFLSMEYVDGGDLGMVRMAQPDEVFLWEDLKPLVEQVCAALVYAHAEGHAHGALEPSNILIRRDGRVKLANYGFPSRDFAATPNDLPYISPQRLGGEEPDVLDDVYSLGAVLYESLTGSAPFVTGDVPFQIANVLPVSLMERLLERAIVREIPEKISTLVESCLAKDRSQRPTAAAVIEGIVAQSTDSPSFSAAASITPVEEAAALVGVLPEKPDEESDAEEIRASGRIANGTKLAVAVGIMLVLAFGLVWRYSRPPRQINRTPSPIIPPQATPIQPEKEVLSEAGPKPTRIPANGTYLGEGPGFSYRYSPKEAQDVDTNAINVGVRFSGEGAATAHCSYVCTAGKTNNSIGSITYNFRAAEGFVIEDMHLSQSTTLYTSGRIRGMYSLDGGRTFTEFYLSAPFRGKSFSFARAVDLPSLNSPNVLIRYILQRYAGSDYSLQFLRDCDDGPTALEITGSIRPRAQPVDPKTK
jgi:serine/threonine protein kinase